MTRREALDYVGAQLDVLETLEFAAAYAEWAREEIENAALRGRLRGIVVDPDKAREVRAIAQTAIDLLNQHFD